MTYGWKAQEDRKEIEKKRGKREKEREKRGLKVKRTRLHRLLSLSPSLYTHTNTHTVYTLHHPLCHSMSLFLFFFDVHRKKKRKKTERDEHFLISSFIFRKRKKEGKNLVFIYNVEIRTAARVHSSHRSHLCFFSFFA